jgi:hypothetical protein
MTRNQLNEVAKDEIWRWKDLPSGLVMAILFAFIHRVTTGETIEEFMSSCTKPADYEI